MRLIIEKLKIGSILFVYSMSAAVRCTLAALTPKLLSYRKLFRNLRVLYLTLLLYNNNNVVFENISDR